MRSIPLLKLLTYTFSVLVPEEAATKKKKKNSRPIAKNEWKGRTRQLPSSSLVFWIRNKRRSNRVKLRQKRNTFSFFFFYCYYFVDATLLVRSFRVFMRIWWCAGLNVRSCTAKGGGGEWEKLPTKRRGGDKTCGTDLIQFLPHKDTFLSSSTFLLSSFFLV